uniref:Uncharacterized protein n=1 Tax=virus sp. ct0sl4 TaxID=2826788 RepID=A0A8S5MPF4_9VIRU|nr:MAG TPA: hypothetical protein [virus sp. ct0sl4]
MSKFKENLNATEVIIEAIQTIARKGITNPKNGIVKGTGKVTGYVAKIHTEGEFAGTVDVQEFSHVAIEDQGDLKIGYHEAVRLSAIQDSSSDVVLIPKLYSEVVVTFDPVTQIEYVTMFSQVDWVKIDSHEKITIGVSEHEEFDADDPDGPDVDELEPTGAKSKTTYEKDKIVQVVYVAPEEKPDGEAPPASEGDGQEGENQEGDGQESGEAPESPDSEEEAEEDGDGSKMEQTPDAFSVDIQKGKGTLLVDKEKILLTSSNDSSKIRLVKDEGSISTGDMEVRVTPDTVYVGGEGSHAVLGEELCDILMKMLQAIASIKTTTQLGPQPPVNIAEFMTIRSQIQAMQKGLNGFISKSVQIKK